MKESFLLYNSFYEPIKYLSDEQLGRLFRAIFNYSSTGEITEDKEILIAFMFIIWFQLQRTVFIAPFRLFVDLRD